MRALDICLIMSLAACSAANSDEIPADEEATPDSGTPGAGGSRAGTGGRANTGGAANTGGRANTGGAANTGGRANTGGSVSTGGSSGTGGCASDGGAPRPANAPVLQPGVWKDINPPELPYHTGVSIFAQGMAIDPCNPSTIYVSVEGFDPGVAKAGLYKTTDGGSTWRKVGPLDEPIRVRVDPRNPQHLYAGDGVRGGTLGFWLSSDGGETWDKTQGWKDLAATMFIDDVYDVAVDPKDFDHVLVTSHSAWGWTDTKWNANAGVLESKDGGTTWIVHEPVQGWGAGHGIWFLGDGATWLFGTQGNGYWRTSDSGATWKQVTTENMAHGGGQVYRAKTGVLYSSGGDEIMRSTDEGVTWTKVASGIVRFTTSVYGDGARLYAHSAYAVGMGPYFTSPESDGVTWTTYQGGTQQYDNGPFEMAFDSVNGILYSAAWAEGLLALKVVP